MSHLKPLTSLRFVAALLVFLDHAPLTHTFADRCGFGFVGVGFFFVLSGFILTWTYHRSFANGLTWKNVRDFYTARFARIYPTLVVATAIAAVVALLIGQAQQAEPPWLQIVFELAMVKTWFPIPTIIVGMNPPSWSIADEAFFYAMFPLITAYLARSLRNVNATATLIGACVLWATVTISFAMLPVNWFVTYYFPPTRMVDFITGIIIAIALLKGARLPSTATMECVSLLAMLAILAAIPRVNESLRYGLIFVPLSALIIVVFAQQSGSISRALSAPTLVRFGQISFAFYLVHVPIISLAEHMLREPFVAPVALLVSLALAWALCAFVEEPMRAWSRYIARKSDTTSKRTAPIAVQEIA